jgi:hypothetical protein
MNTHLIFMIYETLFMENLSYNRHLYHIKYIAKHTKVWDLKFSQWCWQMQLLYLQKEN